MKCICGQNFEPRQTGGKFQEYCTERCANRWRQKRNRDKQSNVNRDNTTRHEDIRFYCGLNETTWNHHPMETGPYVCIAPVTTSTIKDKKTGAKRKVLCNTNL